MGTGSSRTGDSIDLFQVENIWAQSGTRARPGLDWWKERRWSGRGAGDTNALIPHREGAERAESRTEHLWMRCSPHARCWARNSKTSAEARGYPDGHR